MLRSVKDLENYTIRATDGPIGSIKDFYFDDAAWAIRYLVVNAGSWLANRRVLISPMSVLTGDWNGDTIPVSISKDQVRSSPSIDSDKPVSRQYEQSYYGYYRYPYYWQGSGLWGDFAYPGMFASGVPNDALERDMQADHHSGDNAHLRSCNAVKGYHVHAADGEIGHVSGFLIDERSWAVRFLVLETSNWWMGHQVVVATDWIDSVDWSESTVTTDLTRDAVKNSPRYEEDLLLDFAAEKSLYKHYGRADYSESALRKALI